MTDRPIIFSAPMVRALLDGRKTMTRRLLYTERKAKNGIIPAGAKGLEGHQPPQVGNWPSSSPEHYWTLTGWQRVRPGDRLWVRENFHPWEGSTSGKTICYFADGLWRDWGSGWEGKPSGKFLTPVTPSIHMPRWASRLTLVVTATKIERLQDISEADAVAEGVDASLIDETRGGIDIGPWGPAALMNFGRMWSTLHGPASWDANPEVVALTFTVHQRNIDAMKEAA